MLPSSRSSSSIVPLAVPRMAWGVMGVLAIAAPLVHLWAAGFDGTVTVSTLVFTGVGAWFLGLALVSQLLVSASGPRNISGSTIENATPGSASPSPIAAILVPMSIRFAGTFVILGALHFAAVISRNESVFDVLFWYVSLTTIEIVGIVWASKSVAKSASFELNSATKGV